ncbi:MAG: RNA polymerase sigma factor [Dactylosporangium sp.]|nr:RNA polymerase sigma factor [Dactylosporangium sp.]NNJ62505.1 RNA polymerase sigma factor [Dactylosporangium sp.]
MKSDRTTQVREGRSRTTRGGAVLVDDDPSVLDDAAVIERSRRDPEVFSMVFNRHAPAVHRYLARRLGRQAADDLVGETFLVAFRRRASYDLGRASALPWLYGIAIKLVGQRRRDEFREYRLLSKVAPDPDVGCHADRVAAMVAAGAMRGSLLSALADLAPSERDVLTLIAWEGLTYEEAAAAVEVPVGTIRSRLSRARRKIRKALGDSSPTTMFEETN